MNNEKLRAIAYLNCMGFNSVYYATLVTVNGEKRYKVRFTNGDIIECANIRPIWKKVHSYEREHYHKIDCLTGVKGHRNPFFFNN